MDPQPSGRRYRCVLGRPRPARGQRGHLVGSFGVPTGDTHATSIGTLRFSPVAPASASAGAGLFALWHSSTCQCSVPTAQGSTWTRSPCPRTELVVARRAVGYTWKAPGLSQTSIAFTPPCGRPGGVTRRRTRCVHSACPASTSPTAPASPCLTIAPFGTCWGWPQHGIVTEPLARAGSRGIGTPWSTRRALGALCGPALALFWPRRPSVSLEPPSPHLHCEAPFFQARKIFATASRRLRGARSRRRLQVRLLTGKFPFASVNSLARENIRV